MKRTNTTHTTTDALGNSATYGEDRYGSWLELRDKRDRSAIYGNSRSNRERMRLEIQTRGIRIPARHLHLFAEPQALAA